MNFRGKKAFLVPLLVLVLSAGAWGAVEKAEMINGVQWAQWSNQDKLVYIRGISNYVDFDSSAQIQTMKSKGKHWFSISIGLAKILKTKTLGQVVTDVDNYYRNNPGNRDVSVIEIIFKHCAKMCPS
ncbi:MAG: hypothetical protein PHU44_00800 [Syntrophales bacterium]|nr:hypothetical protein [Syntrophales bacterium]MDD5640314.1 hypothetical protein [Syntrophales bacterium]